MKRRLRLGIAAALALAAGAARAQISPGPLSAPHAALEGSSSCLSCHRAGKGVDPGLCLDCHRALGERVHAGQGLHARPDHRACERCHSEHNGREFRLVDFGAGGESGFDHARAGWPLTGRHARVACRDCHRAERVDRALRTVEPGLDPARTYLGQPTACASCHRDPHGGSLAPSPCTDCHDTESWKQVRGFDHAKTRYPLDGKHAAAACTTCHAQAQAAERTLVFGQFRGRALPACADCHKDPHAGRLGADCARCHTTSDFRSARHDAVDHDRTAYPLRGRHRAVSCERCHAPGRGLRVPGYERCETCHRDVHIGQLAAAAGGGACSDCHSVEGFLPARFGPGEHERGRFPLAGAHRAVPCSQCHRPARASELPPPYRRATADAVVRFRFAASACAACHRDPHAGTLDRHAGEQGCRACHDETTWAQARFDHARTRFALLGRHAVVPCAGCHPKGADGVPALAGRPLDCAGCHRDPHAGQLARASAQGPVADCARCHTVDAFRPATGFDHQRDARFALDGRHVAVACARCHPSVPAGGGEPPVVRYKPLPVDCAGCHGPQARRSS